MRFRFNGDADCPDWILAEIYTLSRLSSVKLKLLGQIAIMGIVEPPIQMEKVKKLFADSKLDADIDLKACIACLTYILSAATRFNCDSSALQSELQQLGLPREHSASIKRVFDENIVHLSDSFRSQSLQVNSLEELSADVDKEIECIVLNLKINGKYENISLTPHTVDVLLQELKDVRNFMVQLKRST